MSDWPSPTELKAFHFQSLQGMYFDRLRQIAGGDLLLSDYVADPYYNYLAIYDAAGIDDVDQAEELLLAHERKAAVYAGPGSRADLLDHLKGRGYALYGTDAWMGLQLPADVHVALPATIALEQVDERGVVAYVDAFRSAYSGSTEDDPYGNLDEGYTQALERSFHHPPPDDFERLFVQAVEGNSVVGVATLLMRDDLAGCYGVGVVPSHRRRGIGRALMDHLALAAAAAGTRWLFLQTESGSPVEALYRSFGYQSLFDASYLVRDA